MKMKHLWKKILLVGDGVILAAGMIYFWISNFNYQVEDAYWKFKFVILMAIIFASFSGYCIAQILSKKDNEECFSTEITKIFTKYRFLLSQLVGKEFKLKYRRSYLGIAWSLINPLMLMLVVSAVFSYIFRFNIENFPAYLILGQTVFNFFSEATQLSLLSISTSGQLIKKVYMPKYIFPLSRVMSSVVNFLLTLIPAFIILIYYGIYPSIYLIYLPLFILYFVIFTFGVGLILATMNVFMRDIQHLYGVLLAALGYATPIFYPVDSLSEKMRMVMNFNPLYHYMKYFRNILFYRVCPTVEDNLICLLLALVALVIGIMVFLKKQNKFILYI